MLVQPGQGWQAISYLNHADTLKVPGSLPFLTTTGKRGLRVVPQRIIYILHLV